MPAHRALLTGTLFALAAGLLWGLVFIGPVLLPQYPATLQSFGRYLAFGVIAVPLAWWDRRALARLTRADWGEAFKLALVGNLVYYLFLASSIQRVGAPVPTMIIGTLPVVIAISSNLWLAAGERRLPWARMAPSLGLIGAGIVLVQQAEGRAGQVDTASGLFWLGVALAVGAVLCWTWYPIRNARWLRANPQHGPRIWATAQGVATLPLAALGYAGTWVAMANAGDSFPLPLGPTPERFLLLMLAIGLLASWLGTLFWNAAAQRLPTSLSGQLIVFETLSAMAYAFALRGQWPGMAVWLGMALLVAGVVWAVRVSGRQAAA